VSQNPFPFKSDTVHGSLGYYRLRKSRASKT